MGKGGRGPWGGGVTGGVHSGGDTVSWGRAEGSPAQPHHAVLPACVPAAAAQPGAHLPQAPALAGLHSMYFWYSVRQRSMLPSCSSISMYDLNSLSCGSDWWGVGVAHGCSEQGRRSERKHANQADMVHEELAAQRSFVSTGTRCSGMRGMAEGEPRLERRQGVGWVEAGGGG